MAHSITQAVILSAGLGTRLRSVVKDMPKVMAPFEGKPLLECHIEQFKRHGVTEFFINLHYLPDVITDYFGDGSKWGVKINYMREEPNILGTAGGMKDFDGKLEENFFLMYGDMFSLVDYSKMAAEFLSRPDHVGMVFVGPTSHPEDSDLIEVDGNMIFKKIWQKPHSVMPATSLSLLAAYVFNRKVLEYIPAHTYYEIDHQLLPDLIARGEIVSGYVSDDYIMDIGTPDRYESVRAHMDSSAAGSATPKVSILLATYNRAALLSPTIESVRAQTFTDWEIVIADDGSSDTTPAVVAEWQAKEPRIIYVRSDVNQGISKNYNMGFGKTRGAYIAMIDDDDPWCDREKLAKQVAFLESNPEYVGCGGGVIVIDQTGKELYRYHKPETDAQIRERQLFGNPMANSTTMFRRAAAVTAANGESYKWYDETTRYSGDRDFWLKMGLVGKLCNAQEYYSFYTMNGANTSISKLKPHLKASLMIMKRYKGKYPHYATALAFNRLQYAYAFLPEWLRRRIHRILARLKRLVVG